MIWSVRNPQRCLSRDYSIFIFHDDFCFKLLQIDDELEIAAQLGQTLLNENGELKTRNDDLEKEILDAHEVVSTSEETMTKVIKTISCSLLSFVICFSLLFVPKFILV